MTGRRQDRTPVVEGRGRPGFIDEPIDLFGHAQRVLPVPGVGGAGILAFVSLPRPGGLDGAQLRSDAEGHDEDVREVLATERASTLKRLHALVADYDGIVTASADANADDEHDPEGATIAFERAQVGALVAQAQSYLGDLDRALARLAEGRYWACERCGSPITPERLSARPATRTCIRCAAMHAVDRRELPQD
jgi:RNA polymerase-binding transcription factor DksA